MNYGCQIYNISLIAELLLTYNWFLDLVEGDRKSFFLIFKPHSIKKF
jgi:hypothetical protein